MEHADHSQDNLYSALSKLPGCIRLNIFKLRYMDALTVVKISNDDCQNCFQLKWARIAAKKFDPNVRTPGIILGSKQYCNQCHRFVDGDVAVSAHSEVMGVKRDQVILNNVGFYAWLEMMHQPRESLLYSWFGECLGMRGAILSAFHSDGNRDASRKGRELIRKMKSYETTLTRSELQEMRPDIN